MALSLTGIARMSGSFLDTNIVIYSLGNDSEKRERSIELISDHPVISVQVLNEAANTLLRKFAMPINVLILNSISPSNIKERDVL